MTSITIRDVPEGTKDRLAARAARSGRSLQEYLRLHLIDVASRPDPEQVADQIRARKALTGAPVSIPEILAHRDADRR